MTEIILNPETDIIPESQHQVGLELVSKRDEVSVKKGVRLIELAAINGHKQAIAALGALYYKGPDISNWIPRDIGRAINWLRIAAEQEDAQAISFLGEIYFHGDGVPQDYAQAVKWYHKAAEKGDEYAQHNLGVAYERGLGVNKDLCEAFRWYKLAANNGNTASLHNLANFYYSGKCVRADLEKAIQLYRDAAAKGDADSQWALGRILIGAEYPLDTRWEGANWIEKSAKQGHCYAAFELGLLLAKGEVVDQNLRLAHMFLSVAADAGITEAETAMKKVKDLLGNIQHQEL